MIFMGNVIFDEKDLDQVYSYESTDNSWWDHDDIYYDSTRKAFVERKYRDDQYTDAKHPKWEIFTILAQGQITKDEK
jgi:hypothetical protein